MVRDPSARGTCTLSGMHIRLVRGLFVVPVLLASCGGSSDPFNRIEASYSGMVDSICHSCPGATGSASESECRTMANANNPFTGTQWECQRSAYHMYSTELGPYYDCIANSVSTFDGCMRNAVATCPPASSATSACSNQLTANIQACPRPDSIAASQAVAACSPSP
jgi:hypothetical protein